MSEPQFVIDKIIDVDGEVVTLDQWGKRKAVPKPFRPEPLWVFQEEPEDESFWDRFRDKQMESWRTLFRR